MLMTSPKEKLFKGLVAAFAALCLYQAVSGCYFYRGKLAFNDGNYSDAMNNLKISLTMEKREEALLLMGQAILKTEEKTGGALKSRAYFEQIIALRPRNAKALIYLAATYVVPPEAASPESWRLVRKYLIDALQYEPGNAWIHYEAGRMFLLHNQFLTPEDKQKALFHLKKSLEIRLTKNYSRFLEQPSNFVRPVLNLVWENGHDFSNVTAVVPEEFSSYRALLEWMDQKGLWLQRKEVHAVYLRLRDSYYAAQCELGEKLLTENKYKEALEAFRKAYWASDWAFNRAKAGILIAEEKLGILPDAPRYSLFHNDWQNQLKSVLEDETVSDSLVKGLQGAVTQAGSNVLTGLYAARTGDCASAVNYLEKDGRIESSGRRFLAICYKDSQKDEEAGKILSEALPEELTDLRDLLLLNEWLPGERDQVSKAIAKAETLRIPSKAWWGDQGFSFLLSAESKKNLTLNLRPGTVTLKIVFKSLDRSKASYLVFCVNQKDLGGAVASAAHWQTAELKFETAGGIQWLTVEILNQSRDAQSNVPAVELGAVSINYLGK